MIALELWRDQNQKGFFITDDTIMQRFRPGWAYGTTDQEPEKADSVHHLPGKLGVDPRELEKTANDFNAACNKNMEFNLMKLVGKATKVLSPNTSNWMDPIDKAPFYGYLVTLHLTLTYGGG